MEEMEETGTGPWFRWLFHDITDLSDSAVIVDSLIVPWANAQPIAMDWLRMFGERKGDPIPPASDEDLWELYALSRVNQTLLLRFQHGEADGSDYHGPQIDLVDYVRIADLLGLKVVAHAEFHPFFHEIVEIEQATDSDGPIELLEVIWPALMLGPMMFARAGVRVQGGANHIKKHVGESSTMYWAYRRKNRPYSDLSHGWGSNSQWRTDFRRDYLLLDGVCYFNVDAKLRPRGIPEVDSDLTADERMELLLHRCFIRTDKPHADLFPYYNTYALPLS